jgi:hypothetical protein
VRCRCSLRRRRDDDGGVGATGDETTEEATTDEATTEEATTEEEPATVVDQSTIAQVRRSIQRSWTRCNARDVCIEGERARQVTCEQPDPLESRLECFVATSPDLQHGYGVNVTVGATSYSWELDD